MYSLDVAGFINTDQYSGFKQAGNTILYASSTLFVTFGGIGAGANVIANGTSTDSTSGPYATAFGYQALGNATSSGNLSTAVGYQALKSSATVSNAGENTAVGAFALTLNTSGSINSAFGFKSLFSNSSGVGNTAYGLASLLSNTSGSANVGVGANALFSNQTGVGNTAIGYQAGNGVSSNSFSNNSLFGRSTGSALSTGSQNTFIGAFAASTTQTGNNNIALGYDIALPSANGSNQLNIGNLIFGTSINGQGTTLSTGNVGIGTSTLYSRLTVWGTDAASSTLSFNVVNNASTTVFAVFNGGNAQLAGTLTQNSDQRPTVSAADFPICCR